MSSIASKISGKKTLIIRLTASLIITGSFIYFLVKYLDINDFKQLFSNINIYFFLMALLLHSFDYAIRSFRTILILDLKMKSFSNMFFMYSRYYLLNKILPFRLGELSFIYFLKNEYNTSYGKAVGILIYFRIIDLLTVPIFFIAAYLFNYSTFQSANNSAILVISFISLILIFLIFIFFKRILDKLYYFFFWLSKKFNFFQKKLYLNLLKKLENFTIETKAFINWKTNLNTALLLLFDRFLVYLIMFLLFIGFGIKINFGIFIIASSLSILTNVLPINGVGNFGTFEAGWTFGFILAGYNRNLSLVSGFGINIIYFIFTVVVLIIGFFISDYRAKFFRTVRSKIKR